MDTLIDIMITTLTFFIIIIVIIFIPIFIAALGATLSLNAFLVIALEILYGCFLAAIIININ